MRFGLILLFIVTVISSPAQVKLTKKRADEYRDRYAFTQAIDLYQAYLLKKPNEKAVMLDLAGCYVKINDPDNAVKWYSQSIDLDSVDHEHYLNYASMLSEVEKYEESKKWYKKYSQVKGMDARSLEHIAGIDHIDEFYKDSSLIKISPFEFNSSETDFAPCFYKNGVLFSSNRNLINSPVNHNYSWNMKGFLDIYIYQEGDTSVKKWSKVINSQFHEGALTFNEAESQVYFTRNNYDGSEKGKSSQGVNKIKIYKASEGVEGWHSVEEFAFDNDEYSIGDPHFVESKGLMFFCSDKKGGRGSMDIYVSKFKNGAWSEPIAFGPEVNSEGVDRSPFLTNDGDLFFASDGHEGLGGLDIYRGELDTVDWKVKNITNLGYPLNTSKDDFGLITKDGGQTGYFSSNRKGGKGEDDIYSFEIKGKPKTAISGRLYFRMENETQKDDKPLKDGIVEIWDVDENVKLTDLVTNLGGVFSFEAEQGKNLRIRARKDSLVEQELVYVVPEKGGMNKPQLTLIALLPEATAVIVDGIIRDEETQQALSGVDVFVLNEETGEVDYQRTDENGKYRFRFAPQSKFVIKASKSGYLTNCAQIVTGEPLRESKTFETDLKLEKISLDKVFTIENVYFDLSKWDIRPDAAIELNKVVQFLQENPSITVELSSHTDCRGSDQFNLNLSDKRAKSSRNYIVSQGIAEDRIHGQGYGEQKLTNHCDDGVRCTEKEHQANRRTEMKITGIKEPAVAGNDGQAAQAGSIDPNGDYSDCQTMIIK